MDDRLHAQFRPYSAKLDHWREDTFYAHAVIEPFLDWHVKFDLSPARRAIQSLEITHLEWKAPVERFLFTRNVD